MASRVETRTQLIEYGQLFFAAFTVVFCTVWVTFEVPRLMDKLYMDSGMEYRTYGILRFPWIGLVLVPAYFATIFALKRRQVGRAAVIVAAYLFAVASLVWVAIAFWTITLPLTPIGESV